MTTLACDSCTADVSDLGAQVLSFTPAGAADLLWLSAGADLARAPIRGGVPVCFPWFGPGREPGISPSHGFARTSTWTPVGVTRSESVVATTYTLDSAQASSPHWPHGYRATLGISVGEVLDISLTVQNTGETEFSYEEALHAYLSVGDVRQCRLLGLDGATYVDKARGGERGTQTGDLVLAGEVDRVYASTRAVKVVDPVLRRVITVRTFSSASTVVWNPGAELAARMPDVGDQWPQFVCVEGGNVLTNAVVLAPGGAHTLRYRVRVDPLPEGEASADMSSATKEERA